MFIMLLGFIPYIIVGLAWSRIYYLKLDSENDSDKIVRVWINIFFWPITILGISASIGDNVDSSKEDNKNG